MKKHLLKSCLFAIFCVFCAFNVNAASSLFSNYGQIQNVSNYSSNPFWTPNSPYNTAIPRPVYATGPDLKTEDCMNVVQSLVAVQCMVRDNCKNTSLSEIRPEIMIQLSKLPNHNYVTACAGFVDSVYEKYVEYYGTGAPTQVTAFPSATTPNPNTNGGSQIENPYKSHPAQWQLEMQERTQELEELQRQNASESNQLSATNFPATYADLSFSERIANEAAGLEPYKDMNAYREINVKTAEEWCADHPDSSECIAYKKQTQQNQTPDQTSTVTDSSSKELVNLIVEFLNPQTTQERAFFTALATAYVAAEDKDYSLVLDDSFVYNFLSENDNLEKYKQGLITLSGTAENDDLKIYLDWDEILIQISTVLDAALRKRGALVCENNRSYQVGLDTALWVATAVAAIASFGSGGVAVASGRAALGAGLKALAKGAGKVGLKQTSKRLAAQGGKQLAKAAMKVGLKKSMAGYAKYAGKGLAKRLAKKVGENLATKKARLLATGAVVGAIYETVGKYGVSQAAKPNKKSRAGKLYSWVESGVTTEFINCQDIDYGEGCYAVCGHDQPDDDLNTKVFQPLLGHTYCVSDVDYTLYDMETQEPLMLDNDQYAKIVQKIKTDIIDQGRWTLGSMVNKTGSKHGCDWNEDDIDMYFGSYIYDPDTLQPSGNLIMEEVIRIDD